mgnify:CR=1 FL=1
MDDLRKQLERQMLIEQVQRQEVGSKLTITEEEARQYYAQHPEEFTDSASVTLREIFIEVPAARPGGVNVARDDEAQKKIDDVRARALKGEDFAKLAAEVSTSPSKANGGLIGPFSHDDMSPQLLALDREDEAGRHHAADPHAAAATRSSSSKSVEGRRRCSRSTRSAI